MKNTGGARSVNKRASEPASKATSKRASEPASRGSRARSVDQQAIDVGPIILGHRRDFTQVLKQSEDRGASIKFYGPRAGGLALSDKYEITFCHGRMKQYLMRTKPYFFVMNQLKLNHKKTTSIVVSQQIRCTK